MKKKIIPLVALTAIILFGLTACQEPTPSTQPSSDSASVVTSNDPTSNVPTSEKPVTSSNTVTSSEAPTSSPSSSIVIGDPTLTISGEKSFTVAAGQNLTLPTVSAKDYDNKDLTSLIEVEDLFENKTISNGVFNAKTAGVHRLAYSVETADGRYAEDEIQVTVTPHHAETFDVTDHNDPAAIKTYGTFKENFAKGRKSPLAAVTDSNNGSYLTATEEAINGNSMVILPNQLAGSASNSLFLGAFNDSFNRGVATTYHVSFKYKVLEGSQADLSNFYFGLSWDEFSGLNNAFVGNKCEIGTVYEYSCSFPGTKVAMTGNAYFFFFKLTAAATETKVVIDDFVVSAEECAAITEVTPTAADLQASGGFTWDWSSKGGSFSNGSPVIIDNLDNNEAKTAMKASEDFGTNAIRLINADGHLFSGLTKDNMIVDKKLIIDMTYYAVNGNGFYLIMMGTNGNPTQTVTTTNEGNIYKVHLETKIESGWYQLNVYGANNPNFEIYLGKMNVQITEPDVVEAGKTPLGNEVGKTWNYGNRQWGPETKTNWKLEAFDGNADVIANSKMGSAPWKASFLASNSNMEWCQMGGQVMENEQTYEITVTYYVKEWAGGRLMYNFDNNVFLEIGSGNYTSVGFHEETIRWKANRNVDFFSFYIPGDTAVPGVFYIANVSVKLVETA